jgi:PhoPQ-activated pathogenicity-related protein
VDARVVAIVPIVIDVLNVIRSFQHHYRCYGFWAPAVKDYFEMKLMDVMDTKRYRELMAISDPYSYRDRYTMPKLLINSAGDQFFLPDSSRFYFDKLPGEKYLRYEPNSDHSLKGTDLKETFTAFYQSVLDGSKRPSFQWTFEHDNAIRVTTKETPAAVKLWQASNPEHRDFRLESVGPIYHSSLLEPESPGVYVARIEKPEKGWTAFFVELTYQSSGKYPFRFTTAVRVVPDTEPYPAPKPGETRMGGE